MPSGYIKLYYQIEEWRFWDRPFHTQVWVHILMKVNWKDAAYKYGEQIGPGETIITLRGFAEECGISKSTLARILNDLEAEKQIVTSLRQGRTFIKVLNYAVFQGSDKKTWDRRKDTREDTDEDINEDINEDTGEDISLSINRRSKEHKNRRREEKGKPSLSDVMKLVYDEDLNISAERFFEYYQAKDWRGVTDWKEKAREWSRKEKPGKHHDVLPAYMIGRDE